MKRRAEARFSKSFTGDLEGESQVEYLMMYRPDGSASFVGLERFTGRIGDRSGTFVLQRTGTYEAELAKESYSVVPGSGSGAARTARSSSSANHHSWWIVTAPPASPA